MKTIVSKRIGVSLASFALVLAPVAALAQGQMAHPAQPQTAPAASSAMNGKGGMCCGMSGMKKKGMTRPRHGTRHRSNARPSGTQHKATPAAKQTMPMKDDM